MALKSLDTPEVRDALATLLRAVADEVDTLPPPIRDTAVGDSSRRSSFGATQPDTRERGTMAWSAAPKWRKGLPPLGGGPFAILCTYSGDVTSVNGDGRTFARPDCTPIHYSEDRDRWMPYAEWARYVGTVE